MKLNFLNFKVVLLGLCGLLFVSCDDDDDNVKVVDEAVQITFQQLYPNTPVSAWEVEMGLYKADFVLNNSHAEAWFKPDGTWVKTETDVLPADLPLEVKDFVSQNYPNFYVEEADWIDTPDRSFYELELDAPGANDVYVWLLPDGTLIN